MARAHGIDISYSQKQFDYSVNPDDIQFVIIRASNGTTYKDSQFDTFVKATAEVPIRGAYHYFRSEESPAKSWYHSEPESHVWFPWKEQAVHFLNCVGDIEFDFYALDIEVNDLMVARKNEPPERKVKKADNVADDKFHENARKWIEYVADKKKGKRVLIYTGVAWYREWMDKWPLWIAQWTGVSGSKAKVDAKPDLALVRAKKWRFWQYAVEKRGKEFGVAKGAGKEVDLNVFNGELADLRRWLKLPDEPEPAPVKPKEPEPATKPGPSGEQKDEKPQVITWRQVIDATLNVAEGHGENATTWFREADVRIPAGSWDAEYTGKPIQEWTMSFGEEQQQIQAEILERLEQR